ncbi:uncharacterized protein CANTADRAFT_26532, partial [Suhomyces tanzawaensis NRRL Y-17324]
MVRLKQRYILFDILYPPSEEPDKTLTEDFHNFSRSQNDALLSLHQSSPASISQKTLTNALRKTIQEVYGDFGSGTAAMQLTVKYFSNKTSTGIIRCGRQSHRVVVAALSMINTVEGNSVIIRCTRVSGTIKKCEQYSIARTRELMNLVGKNDSMDLDNLMSSFKETQSDGES